MSKKTKSKLNLNVILYAVAILLAVVSVCMIFTEVCGIKSGDDTGYILTGIQATFGYSKQTTVLGSTVTSTYTVFSFMNLLIYILLIAGVVLALLRLFKVVKSGAMDWVVAALFIVAGILYFVMPNFVVYGAAWEDLVALAMKADAVKTVLAGGIVGGISSIVAGGTVVVNKFIKK